MSYIVYIIKNNNGKIYIGQTSQLEKRIGEHNFTGQGYTSKYRPWHLIHKEEYLTRKDAMSREKFLKTGKGRDWIKNTILDG